MYDKASRGIYAEPMKGNPRLEALKRLPLTDGGTDILAVHYRLVELAKRATVAPESLSVLEIAQIGYALEVHYAQLGIG